MTDFESIWSPAKVFSPTAAKQASLQQKDWAYVDNFLASRFAPKPVPKYERNPDTLKALLALAAANEAADEEKDLERRVKEKTLAELQKREQESITRTEPLLTAVEEHLTDDGRRCLNSVALLGVALASNSTDAPRLSAHLIELSKQEFSVRQQTARIDALHARLQSDLSALRETLRHLNTNEVHKLPPDLAARVTEWARGSRHLKNKAENYREELENAKGIKESLTVPALVAMETEILQLKEHVLDLEAQARGYQGLPPEKDLARLEVERVQEELRELEKVREGMYDGMT
ncbi:hypothetical protein EDC01DRAFT_639511 [Geopyxis carbonaria]|nr:hypothetical protein EDC01DRAFT_639511 [Geopyxis carbonaria]